MTKVLSYVALLRGINVGGKNKLPMVDLAAMFTEAGCLDVKTFSQSGNVLFRAGAGVAPRVPAAVSRRIEERFGYKVPLVLRTAGELAGVVGRNPFLVPGADTKKFLVLFLADEPTPRAVAVLDPKRSPPDEFAVRGREIFLQCPNGQARTKLTNVYFDAKLGTMSTGRNWRTLLKLVELSASP